MPDYLKRGLWLRGVAQHIDDELLAALLATYADRMICKADPDAVANKHRLTRPE